LNLYSERPRAFDGQELSAIAMLGGVVGHAMAAVERKHALLSDEVVELEFLVPDFFESVGIEAAREDPVRGARVVPVEDEDFVLFGTTTPEGVETVGRLVEAVPSFQSVTIRERGSECPFEVHVGDRPVLSTLASLGGSVEELAVEGGDSHVRVHVPPNAEGSRFTEVMTEVHPSARLTRRQLSVEDRDTDTGVAEFLVGLTDRQRTTLEAAFHAGYFRWPRDASGEDIADTLGVSAPHPVPPAPPEGGATGVRRDSRPGGVTGPVSRQGPPSPHP
jgi:hypothetical protein